MHLSTLLPAMLLSAPTLVKASEFIGYTCYGCNCNGFQSFNDDKFENCVDLLQGAASWGVSATPLDGVFCTLYSGKGCSGSEQNVGHHNGQSWGCTNSNIGWVQSVKCWPN
ncbi:hypothetical protein BJY00DRAFT_315834 [Aspergillus carlsbadensis]|nr:hypothetical protein BJY00DRAFT_315834 [Aspergillus carlsbadensis]